MPDKLDRGLMFVAPPGLWGSNFHPLRLLADTELAEIKAAVGGARQFYSVSNGVGLIPLKGLMVKDPIWMGETSTIAATVAVKQAAADKAVLEWMPSPNIVIDIARLSTGEYKVVEFNCLSSSGFYSSNVEKLVQCLEAYVSP